MKENKLGVYYIPKYTVWGYYIKKDFSNKAKKVYVAIEGEPVHIINSIEKENKKYFVADALSSASINKFLIPQNELKKNFIPIELDKDNFITNLDSKKYPKRVNITEFLDRDNVKKIIDKYMNVIKKWPEGQMKELLIGKLLPNRKRKGGKLEQLKQCAGSPAPKIDNILAHIKKMNEEKEPELNEKFFGNQIFNRRNRCSPVGDNLSREEFMNSPSYPFPIGIRKKDFCLYSDMILVIVEMIRQLFTFKKVEPTYREKMQEIFTEFNIPPQFNNNTIHRCRYCNKELDLNLCSSEYASQDNYTEICHQNPNVGFSINNMYWGHGECNRRQGGYTEEERIDDGIRLLKNNSSIEFLKSKIEILNSILEVKKENLKKKYLTKSKGLTLVGGKKRKSKKRISRKKLEVKKENLKNL